jgi:cardiolipin synthase (CMP-forming)
VVLRQLPHLLTIIRLAASPFLVWLLLQSRFREALATTLAAGLTDWFDGFAARRLHVSGQLGVILDPVADKILLMTVFLTLGYIGAIPKWLIYLVVGRDVIIVAGALALRVLRNIHRFLPSALGKISTFFQIMFVLLVLLQASFRNEIFVWSKNTAMILCALFTTISGFDYIRRGVDMSKTSAGLSR